MKQITASFYDGKTSQKKEVCIYFEGAGHLRIAGLESDLTYNLSEIRITPRVGNTPRSLYLPKGAKCETLDNDTIDAILRLHGRGRWQAFLYSLESKLGYVLLSLVLTIVGVWGLIVYGIPALAKRVAYAVPASVDVALGREGLKVLDQVLFSPSELDEKRQNQLLSRFDNMTQGLTDGHNLRLEFRNSERIGPNAFALPSGIIIVTDELVSLAEHHNELVAILAHEIGHIRHRHALRSLLQNSAAVLLISSVTGDVTSITTLSAALPTILLEAKYSRAFETEADHYALQYLRDRNVSTRHFANILVRLEKVSGTNSSTQNYLHTHPATSRRLEIIKGQE